MVCKIRHDHKISHEVYRPVGDTGQRLVIHARYYIEVTAGYRVPWEPSSRNTGF